MEALFEYEKAESESLYRSGLEEAKQNMIKQLEQQMQELKDSEEPDNMKSNGTQQLHMPPRVFLSTPPLCLPFPPC